mmetsp:Transcript_2861/g.4915  ORF Transcript_2861/g.4915 Transcript_2861/m.4915 type:complete len:115 (-) Transcript_2861:262-606(-)
MLEVPLTVVAWVSVVLIQAIVHFRIIPRRRRSLIHQASLENVETLDEIPPLMASSASQSLDFSENDYLPDEGDEVEVDKRKFIELLDQTGSDLIRGCRSREFFERRAAEQLRIH